jgi:hypothetical protein
MMMLQYYAALEEAFDRISIKEGRQLCSQHLDIRNNHLAYTSGFLGSRGINRRKSQRNGVIASFLDKHTYITLVT